MYFEVLAEPLRELCRQHIAARRAVEQANDAMAKELGGVGCWWRGDRLSAIGFARANGVPAGWRQVQGDHHKMIACLPQKKSAAGKAIAKRINDAPHRPGWKPLLVACGFPPEADWVHAEGFTFLMMSAVRVDLPAERFFLTCGREADATWPIPDGVQEVSEATVRFAIAQHNKLAEEARAEQAAA